MVQMKRLKWQRTHCPKGHGYSGENVRIGAKGERVCRACQRERMARKRENPEFLARQREATQRHRDANRPAVNAAARQRSLKNREWTEEFKCKLACALCGERHPSCLEFHHRDPSEKDGEVSIALAHWSKEKLEAEIAKCDVLCANCHRKHHWRERSSPEVVARVEALIRMTPRQWGNKDKKACLRGHPYDEENTKLIQGRRRCRACHRQKSMEYYERRKAARQAATENGT